MTGAERAHLVGAAGCALLMMSFVGVFVAPSLSPATWVPSIWLVVITVTLPVALVAGFIAAKASRWWYFLPAAAFFALVLLVAASS